MQVNIIVESIMAECFNYRGIRREAGTNVGPQKVAYGAECDGCAMSAKGYVSTFGRGG